MKSFLGYPRPDGSVGVRNHVLVMAPVDCSSEVARKIAARVEGTVAVTQHNSCLHDDMVVNSLAGVGTNPNIAAVLLVGLGCESLTPETVAEKIAKAGIPVEALSIQKEGGTTATIERGIGILGDMARHAAAAKTERFPLSKLTIALECGGSDATSGLAANPALGIAADMFIDAGATVLFSEPQEMTGTQDILSRRAVSPEGAREIRLMIDRQEERLRAMGIDSRWMPEGNVAGGLTTIEEKSMGAIRKAGTRPIQGVLRNDWDHFDRPSRPGLWVQDGTAWDVPSITHMAAAGAQIACFTTGCGSTVGHAVVPVLKITGNPDTYRFLSDNMDINAAEVLEGHESLHSVGVRIFEAVIETASGRQTRAEIHGMEDFLVFKWDRTAEYLLGHCGG
jgi:altronate dehydratase large subunit